MGGSILKYDWKSFMDHEMTIIINQKCVRTLKGIIFKPTFDVSLYVMGLKSTKVSPCGSFSKTG